MTPQPSIREQFAATLNGAHDTGASEVAFRMASDIVPERIVWIWYGFLAQGKLSLLEGNPKLGKSTITADIAARISTGTPFPGHTMVRTPRGVVILSAEDGPADTIVPRLAVAGADLSRISIVSGITTADDNEAWIGIDKHLAELEAHITAMDAQIIVIDPLMAYLGNVNAHKDQDVRAALGPLMTMLDRTGCACLLVRHLNKAAGSDIVTRGGGSIGISGAARLGMFVARDPDDDERRVMAQSLTNLTPEQPSLGFSIVSHPGSDVARIVWADAASRYNAEDLLDATQGAEDREELTDAGYWLLDYLSTGPKPAKEVIQEARKAGHAERTLKRAKAACKVRSIKDGYGHLGSWSWCLPEHAHSVREPGSRVLESLASYNTVNNNIDIVRETKDATTEEGGQRDPRFGDRAPLAPFPTPWEEEG